LEQPLPPYGSCNLGSLDISKFVSASGEFNEVLFEKAVRLAVRFLDSVIEVNSYPTLEIAEVSKKSRPVGVGLMGIADFFMKKKLAYGSPESREEFGIIAKLSYDISKNESEILGKLLGIPEWCKNLPKPRRNITLTTYAPTGTISILAGCNSGIEPYFSEITERKDKTGEYIINSPSEEEYFRCAVSSSGEKEVTWEEHILMQAIAQKYSDSGVSKTINFPNKTHRDTIGKAFMMAWYNGCKGITVYRNGSRDVEESD
jgi:ribonucleoside-diphosphate reductase alpha chain